MFRRRRGRTEEAAEPAHGAVRVLDALRRDLAATSDTARKLGDTEVGVVLASADDAELRASGLAVLDVLVRETAEMAETLGNLRSHDQWWALRQRLEEGLVFVARRKPAWTPDEARVALRMARRHRPGWRTLAGLRFAISVAEGAASKSGAGTITEELVRTREVVDGPGLPGAERVALRRRLTALLAAGGSWEGMLTGGDAWGPAVRDRLGPAEVAVRCPLLQHLGKAGATPTARWRAATPAHLDMPGAREVVRILVAEVAAHERGTRREEHHGQIYVYPADLLDAPNAEIARGAIWAAATLDEDWVVPTLRDTALFCGTTAAGGGEARSEKLANACAGALGTIEGDAAVTALAAIQARIKNRSIRKRVDAALAEIAARGGLSPSQLLERTVPAFGLDERSRSRTVLGDHVAELALEGDRVSLSFSTTAGRRLSTVPAAVKAGHADELARLKSVVKEANKALPVERARLEGLLAVDRTWERAEWDRLYLGHPVTGRFARRLLWDLGDGRRWETVLPDAAGDAWGALPDAPLVRLWHPIRASAEDVAGWRSDLMKAEVRQPFKQAYREVYRLTPAEEETVEYSNRFAAHVLRYPQAAALMRARGWNASSLGYWDGGHEGRAVRDFPDARLRAVFYFDLVEQEADRYGTPLLCTTDQVRFETLALAVPERVPLADVPPLVLSEAMRDVDLFVGVTSIAADPEWIDRGTDRRFDVYWREFGFGELTEPAETRRAALERLIPRTRIAERCRITDRWLVVRGNLRTYRIHLGSGNVLMEPDDAYLCIVPDRRDLTDKLFLPFEEDGGRLSVIMSKAFLLAADDTITDPTILRQLRQR